MKRITILGLLALALTAMQANAQQIAWSHLYGDPQMRYEHARVLCGTEDGNLMAIGAANPAGESQRFVKLLKFTPEGDSLWARTPARTYYWEYYSTYSADNTYDNGFIIVGLRTPNAATEAYSFYMKVDQDGESLWEKSYVVTDPKSFFSYVEETSDSGFILTGHCGSWVTGDIGNSSILVVKTDSLGECIPGYNEDQWAKTFDINLNSYNRSYCVRQVTDGGYVVSGSTGPGSFPYDMFLLRLGADGDSVWCKTYATDPAYGWKNSSVVEHSDGGFLLVGWRGYNAYQAGECVVRTDQNGTELNRWHLSSGGCLFSVRNDNDGGFITIGKRTVIRLNDMGDTLWSFSHNPPDTSLYMYDIFQMGSNEYILGGSGDIADDDVGEYMYLARIEPVPTYVCGDADGSGAVDIDDVVYLIAYIFSGGPSPDPVESGDADCAGGVDIDDVVYLIGYIFSGGNAPCDPDDDGTPDC